MEYIKGQSGNGEFLNLKTLHEMQASYYSKLLAISDNVIYSAISYSKKKHALAWHDHKLYEAMGDKARGNYMCFVST